MGINPAYHPNYDDGSDRYIVVECDIQDTAVLADKDAHARQVVRIILRRRPALTYLSEKTDLMGILKADNVVGPNLTHEEQRGCSECFCEQYRNSTTSMDGWSSQSCSTSGHLRDVIVITTKTWRLSASISETDIGHAKH
eukprot:1538620-Pyramimonas_sp.AAC.1